MRGNICIDIIWYANNFDVLWYIFPFFLHFLILIFNEVLNEIRHKIIYFTSLSRKALVKSDGQLKTKN